jgi:hypothetical protein
MNAKNFTSFSSDPASFPNLILTLHRVSFSVSAISITVDKWFFRKLMLEGSAQIRIMRSSSGLTWDQCYEFGNVFSENWVQGERF